MNYLAWFIAALGNTVDYWRTRRGLRLLQFINPNKNFEDAECNAIPKYLLKNVKNPFALYLLFQAFILAFFYSFDYFNAPNEAQWFLAGIFACAGFYTNLQTTQLEQRIQIILDNVRIPTIKW